MNKYKILYVHGIGGKDHNEDFIIRLKDFIADKHLDGSIETETFKWDSGDFKFNKIGRFWIDGKDNAKACITDLNLRIQQIVNSDRDFYIVAYSLGAFLTAYTINSWARFSDRLKGVFFIAAALDKEFKFQNELPFKVFNYFSDKDQVLKKFYSQFEENIPGGLVGFSDLNNFRNLRANCSHWLAFDYIKYMPETIGYLTSYWQGYPRDRIPDSKFNIEMPTLGGKELWNNVYETENYIFQQCLITLHYRAISKNDKHTRLAHSRNLHSLLNEFNV